VIDRQYVYEIPNLCVWKSVCVFPHFLFLNKELLRNVIEAYANWDNYNTATFFTTAYNNIVGEKWNKWGGNKTNAIHVISCLKLCKSVDV